MHYSRIFFCASFVTGIAFGCSSSSTTNPGTSGGGDAGASNPDGSTSETDSGGSQETDAGSSDDGSTAKDAGSFVFDVGDGGCITYASASKFCGGASDDSICKYSVTCGKSTDDGQCKINCEMAASVYCYTVADAKCLQDALASQSCSALKACKWVL